MGNKGQKYDICMNWDLKNDKGFERGEIYEKEIKCDEHWNQGKYGEMEGNKKNIRRKWDNEKEFMQKMIKSW